MRLVDTTGLSLEEMAPLWPQIIACIETYVRRFAHEETVANVIHDCASGRRKMWLCMDGDTVVLVPVTEIVKVHATGNNRLILAECGGSRLPECLPLLKEIEDWARREHSVTDAQMIGRKGWARLLPKYGYREKARVFEKRF